MWLAADKLHTMITKPQAVHSGQWFTQNMQMVRPMNAIL